MVRSWSQYLVSDDEVSEDEAETPSLINTRIKKVMAEVHVLYLSKCPSTAESYYKTVE